MAKQISWVSINFNGNIDADDSVTISYCVYDSDDTDLKKSKSTTCSLPEAGQDYDVWRTAQIDAIKTAEGIS